MGTAQPSGGSAVGAFTRGRVVGSLGQVRRSVQPNVGLQLPIWAGIGGFERQVRRVENHFQALRCEPVVRRLREGANNPRPLSCYIVGAATYHTMIQQQYRTAAALLISYDIVSHRITAAVVSGSNLFCVFIKPTSM